MCHECVCCYSNRGSPTGSKGIQIKYIISQAVSSYFPCALRRGNSAPTAYIGNPYTHSCIFHSIFKAQFKELTNPCSPFESPFFRPLSSARSYISPRLRLKVLSIAHKTEHGGGCEVYRRARMHILCLFRVARCALGPPDLWVLYAEKMERTG
jgi:hypothetical protein